MPCVLACDEIVYLVGFLEYISEVIYLITKAKYQTISIHKVKDEAQYMAVL